MTYPGPPTYPPGWQPPPPQDPSHAAYPPGWQPPPPPVPPREGWLRRRMRGLIAGHPIRDAWIDLTDVPPGQRWVIRAAYLAIVVLLGLMLTTERIALDAGSLTGTGARLGDLAGRLAFALGWGLLLGGAALSRRRVLVPVALAFLVANVASALGPGGVLTMLTAAVTVGIWYAARRTAGLHDAGRAAVLAALVPTALCLLLSLLGGSFATGVGQGLTGLWMYPVLLVLWALSGLAVVDTATDLTRWLTGRLATWLAPGPLGAAVVLLVLVGVALAVTAATVLTRLAPGATTGEELTTPQLALAGVVLTQILVAVPTLLVLLALALGRRWSPRTVLTVFAVSLVVPMLVGLLIVSMSGYDLTDTMGIALQATGLVPPMMLFAGLLAVSLLSLGSSFAAGDGPVLPRPARIYLSLGFVLLMLDFALRRHGGRARCRRGVGSGEHPGRAAAAQPRRYRAALPRLPVDPATRGLRG